MTRSQRIDVGALKQAALDFSNQVREKLGLDPVRELEPGVRANACHCPITNTVLKGTEFIGSTYSAMQVYEAGASADLVNELLPSKAFEFVHEFDRGLIPELIVDCSRA